MKCFNCGINFEYDGIRISNGEYICCSECKNIYKASVCEVANDIDFTFDETIVDHSIDAVHVPRETPMEMSTENVSYGDDSISDCGFDD